MARPEDRAGRCGSRHPGHSAARRCRGAREGRRAFPAWRGDHLEEALRTPRLAAARRAGAAKASWEPPPRVYTSPHLQGNGAREPWCPPGVADRGGNPELRPHSPGNPPPPGRGVISVGSLSGEGRSQAADSGQPQVPAWPTREPAAASRAAAQSCLNIPAGGGGRRYQGWVRLGRSRE